MIGKLTRTILRTFAFALALCATTSAWAADTPLVTTVSGGSFTINNENAVNTGFDNCSQNVSSPTLTIPASTALPSGTKVAISEISIGKRNYNNADDGGTYPDKIRITVGTETYTSAAKSEDASVRFTCPATREWSTKQTYSFNGTGCILEVGETYTITLLNASGTAISGNASLNIRVADSTASLFGDTIIYGSKWRPVQEIKGDIIYTCTVASDGSSTWDITPPTSDSLLLWYEVEESASFDIGTTTCRTAYFNVATSQTLTLTGGSLTVATPIVQMGAGNVVFNASGLDVSGLTAGSGLKVTSGTTVADVASIPVSNPPSASESLQYVVQQRSDGLYISALPKDYKWNTININFTYNNNSLSTESNVGMVGVPGNKWNNYEGTPASYYNAYVCDDTATQTQTLTGLDVTVSGSRGSWSTSLNSASDLRHGYIDDQDADGKRTPTVEISGIPFNKYRAIVYHATEAANSKFGYDTVNGANLCYVDGVLKDGSDAVSWGSAGPKDGAHAIEEGVNTLVTGVYETKPFKVVGHRNDRGCIAAVQVVKVDEATIDTAGTYTLTGLFGSVGTTANLYVNVAENATLNIPSETTIGAIDFNIASGKTLTLTGAKLTATVGGFTVSGGGKVLIDVAGAVNYSAKVIDGRIYGASDIDLTSSAGGARLEIDPADGVYLHVEDVTATLALGSNSYLTGTYVTSSTQAAFSGITLQQFYDGGYTLRGRFAGASIDKLGVESTGYNAYVTDDGEGNVTSIRYEMQAKNNELKCVVITLTPNAGNTGIDVVANGAYWAASSNNPGFSFLNDDGSKKDGVNNGTLGTAYNSNNSYSLYGLNIVGKCVKTLTLSGNEILTVGTDIASAYDTLTVTGSGTLTVSGILNVDTLVAKSGATVNLSETFGARNISIESGANVSHIGGDGSSFYWATLTGAGTLILDPGDGNSYKMSGSNTGYTGEAVVKSGTVKMGDATSFGPTGRSSSIRVKGGATLDTNGASNTEYNKHKNKVILEEGATFTSSVANAANFQNVPCTSITLEGDATVDASTVDVGLAQYYHYNSAYLNIGTYTLTKVGSHDFRVSAIDNIVGTGVIDVQEGTFSICNSCYYNHHARLIDGTMKVAAGATFKLATYDPDFTVKNIELNGTVARESDNSTLTVNGYISGTGTTPMLTLADGATLKPKSSAGGLTVTESLTLSGTINVDLSDVDLTGMSELAIIKGPTQIIIEEGEDCDIADDGFILGSNSSNWKLYSELVSEGTYVLGVRLSTIANPVSWDGEGGTWSVNSFNGKTENYSNQALQTVTFADNGESADPLAVAVSGAKTVNALNFTADHRDITLSGDAITAATVSKSGDGVAIVNNVLSVTTSISVTDGILVLNPNGEDVSDVDGLDDGTLVIYVGAGETTTLPAITATTLIKRGAGELIIDATSDIAGDIVVETGSLTSKASTVWSVGNSVTVKTGAALNINGEVRINKNPGQVLTSVMTLESNATCSVRGNLYAYYSEYVSFAINGAITVDGNFYSKGDIFVGTTGAITVGSSGSLAALWHIENNGTITLPALDRLKKYDNEHDQTKITNSSTGKIIFNLTANMDVRGTDLTAYFAGSGKIILNGNVWCGFSREGQWPSTIAVENNLKTTSGGFVFSRTSTIGTLSGDGLIRTDLDTSEAPNRVVTVLQAANSEWSGTLYKVNGRMSTFAVSAAKGATEKTLKLSGTQQSGNDYVGTGKQLVVNAATETTDAGSVNLTSTWVGDVTVNGEFGGKGTVSGDLTFNAGSTFKVWETGSLTVSGALTLPGSGKVNVDVSAISLSKDGTTIMTFDSVSGNTAAFSCEYATFAIDGNALKAYPAVASVTTTSGVTHYLTVGLATGAAANAGESLLYITICGSGTVNVPYFAKEMKIRNYGGATINIRNPPGDVVVSAPVEEDGFVTYTASDVPSSYKWTNSSLGNSNWTVKENWSVVAAINTASRYPQEGDTVIFDSAVTTADNSTVEISPDVSGTVLKKIEIGLNVTFQRSGDSGTVIINSEDGIVLTNADKTFTVGPNITLGTAVTTDVANKVVKSETDNGAIIYSVVDPAAEIVDGDQYGSLANAVEFAEAGDEITLLANASVGSVGKAITLDIDTYELTLTSADALDSITSLKGTGTLVLPAGYAPTSALATLLQGANWQGTLVVARYDAGSANIPMNTWGNSGSKIELSGVSGGMNGLTVSSELVLDDGSYGYGLDIDYNNGSNQVTIEKLSGSGTFRVSSTAQWKKVFQIKNADNFTGNVVENSNGTACRLYFGYNRTGSFADVTNAKIGGTNGDGGFIAIDGQVKSGVADRVFPIADGASWVAGKYGLILDGSLEVKGSATITGILRPNIVESNAKLIFDDIGSAGAPKFLTISSIASSANNVKVDLTGATLRDAAKLIDWSAASYSSAPSVSFVFADGSDTLVDSGTTYLLSSEADGLYLRKAVAFTYDGVPPVFCYYPSVAAALSAGTNIYLYDAPNETVTLEAGKTININNKDVSNLTVNSALDEYASPITAVNDAYSLANAASAPVTYYWTGATDSSWTTIGNWKVNASDGPAATRAMESTDSVVFNDGANVTLDSSMTVAGIAVNGAVTITASSKELKTSGNITGTGTLTFVDVCLSSMASGLTVAPNVNFTDDSELGGDHPFTFNGSVGISGRFPQWGCVSVINGAVSVASGAEIQAAGGGLTIYGTTTFNGAFTKSGSNVLTLAGVSIPSTVTPNISAGSITINGAVTVSAGATFTIPASGLTVDDSASFVLGGKSSVLVDNGSGASGKVSTSMTDGAKVISTTSAGVTTYKVGYGTIFSVY